MNEFIVTIPMPFTGESIVDGILVNWLVKPGETVTKGQYLAEIETEKSVWEFESPCDGEVAALKAEPGDVVDVKAPLLEIKTSDENMKHLLEETKEPVLAQKSQVSVESRGRERSGFSASPRVKRMLKEHNIDEKEVQFIKATGSDGRIAVADVEQYLGTKLGRNGKKTHTYINAIGTYVPEAIVDNSVFLEHFPDLSESYIEKVTGIHQRRWVSDETTSDMAVAAAKNALESSRLDAKDIDMIILATTTPDMPLPATACAVQQRLECRAIPAFDIQAACSGWLYGLSVAQQFIKAGVYKNILVIAAESMSRFTDRTDRATAFLFGDGAGAAILSSNPAGHELSDLLLEADSSGYDIIYRKAGGSAMPLSSMETPRDEFWYMDGGRMFRSAVSTFSHIIESVTDTANLMLSDFRWFVPHQANQRILKTVASRIKAIPERFFSNIRNFGNTSAASIPLALKDIESTKTVKSGDKLLLCAVGAGLTAAGGVLTWK